MDIKRPTRKDTEEDILKLQEQFLTAQGAPSAKVVKLGDKRKSEKGSCVHSKDVQGKDIKAPDDRDVVTIGELPSQFITSTQAPPSKKSKFKAHRSQAKQGQRVAATHVDDDDDTEERLERHDTHISKVLSEIVERDFAKMQAYCPTGPIAGAFPTAPYRGTITQESASVQPGKKRSIFAQQFASRPVGDFGMSTTARTPFAMSAPINAPQAVADTAPERVHIVGISSQSLTEPGLDLTTTVKQESKQIHEENLGTMASMSEEEILAEQKNLLQILDPSLVAYLRSKQAAQNSGAQVVDKPTELMDTEPPSVGSQDADHRHIDSAGTGFEELPVKPDKSWVHMDKVESEKLSWMKDLPPAPAAGNVKTGEAARFDLEGKLVAADADIPVQHGLHHHGDEPERAGYTLGELFQLARSANMQQRVLAITVLGSIVACARKGVFAECLSTAIIPALLEGGLMFILRWALDDSTENTMAAAIQGLHSVLVCEDDERAADWVCAWYTGSDMPSLCPLEEPEPEQPEEDTPVKTDADVIREDLVKGLLRMSVLPRLRYILEIWKPPASVVLQTLDVLIRVARHSSEAAYQLTLCPRMMETIFNEFLPTVWEPVGCSQALSSVHGYPVSKAMKLVRVTCTAGRHMAATLVSKYNLMDRVLRFITENPRDLPLHPEEAHALYLESWRAWAICVSYGLTVNHYHGCYPVLVRKMQAVQKLTCNSSQQELQEGCALVHFLEAVTHTAAATIHESQRQKTQRATQDPSAPEQKQSEAIPEINWSHVDSWIQPVESYLSQNLQQVRETYFEKRYDLSLCSSCINYVAAWFSHIQDQPGYNAAETLVHIETVCDQALLPALESQAFRTTLRLTREHSGLLWPGKPSRVEVSRALPELGALLGERAEVCPAVRPQSTLAFLLAVTRLLVTLARIHKGIAHKLCRAVLEDDECLLYLRKVCQAKHPKTAANYFCSFELVLLHQLVTLARLTTGGVDVKLYHQVSLYLLTSLHHGHEFIAHDLLSTVLFNLDFLRDVEASEDVARLDESLQIQDRKSLSSATARVIEVSRFDLTKDTCSRLASVRTTYMSVMAGLCTSLKQSRARFLHDPFSVESHRTGAVGQVLVPVDWVFLPLLNLFNATVQGLQASIEGSVSASTIALVTDGLRWVYLLECWRPASLEPVSLAIKFSRLICTFLVGSDLFLDAGVHAYLSALLRHYCKPVQLDRVDFRQSIPGLASFYDLYMTVLEQYAAVSFGDALFGLYVLFPLQQQHKMELRRAVWGEHPEVLRAINIPLNQMLIPIERFLEPEEENVELIRLYFQALLSGSVSSRRSPVPYAVAVHHINRFFYTQAKHHAKLRLAIIQQICLTNNQILKHHLLHYKRVNPEADQGLELYEELPPIRQSTVDQAMTRHHHHKSSPS